MGYSYKKKTPPSFPIRRGGEIIKMEKYKEGLKKWPFWIFVFFLSLLEMIKYAIKFNGLPIGAILGILLGSFIFILCLYTIFYFIRKGIKTLKRKEKEVKEE